MSDHIELKRLAIAALPATGEECMELQEFYGACSPEKILGLIAECDAFTAQKLPTEIIDLLKDIRRSHGVTLLSNPPQDPWMNNRIDQRIDAILCMADGETNEPSLSNRPA